MRVISLGAGVQSSAMLLMALEGRFGDVPDCAIFADTQSEPPHVYEMVDRLEHLVAPFQIHRVSRGNLGTDYLGGVPESWIPVFTRNELGVPTILRRQCSKNYKIVPIRRKIRELVGPRGIAESWIGISTDEAHRMKPSGLRWLTNRWPLIESGLRRSECADYLKDRGLPTVNSACEFCPLQDWLALKNSSPQSYARAVLYDGAQRTVRDGFDSQFLHAGLIPLGDIKEFRHEKQGRMFLDGFGNECEGVCGT